jgi:uncharacterized protein (UPF0332 family)
LSPETGDALRRAEQMLVSLVRTLEIGEHVVAAAEAYRAAEHAARALLDARLNRVFKKHATIIAEFARLTRGNAKYDGCAAILSDGFKLKNVSDYGDREQIDAADATDMVVACARIIALVAEDLGYEAGQDARSAEAWARLKVLGL